jgi:hypothetical protein
MANEGSEDAAWELYDREQAEIAAADEKAADEKAAESDQWPVCDSNTCYCGFCHEEEDDYQPSQVWYTEPPCGHNSWE